MRRAVAHRLPLRAPLHATASRASGALAGALALLGFACGDGPHAVDATASTSTESAELSIRFDVSGGKTATAEVLAFRATTSSTDSTTTGLATAPGWQPDVLGIVDPLAAQAPDQGCELRDIDLATKALALRGGSIDLQEMTGVAVAMGAATGAATWGGEALRPFPRLYPDVATVVGGVVAEAGPQDVGALPERVTLFSAESDLPLAELAVPSAPRALAVNGAPLAAGLAVDAREGFTVTVSGAAGGQLELRPFGATVAATCAIPANATGEAVISVPRAFVSQLAHLVRAAGATATTPFAVSLEVARRAHLRQGLGGTDARVSVEVRSAVAVELRP